MIKKIFTLFQLGRKLAKSDILNVVSKFKKPPLVIKILFQILSFSFSNQQKTNLNNVNNFLIILPSSQSELLQFHLISFYNYNFQICFFSSDQLTPLD